VPFGEVIERSGTGSFGREGMPRSMALGIAARARPASKSDARAHIVMMSNLDGKDYTRRHDDGRERVFYSHGGPGGITLHLKHVVLLVSLRGNM
jgi:hypothetical protein